MRVYFFKELKPSLISKILFYQNVLKIESTLPPGKKAKRKALHQSHKYSYTESVPEIIVIFTSITEVKSNL